MEKLREKQYKSMSREKFKRISKILAYPLTYLNIYRRITKLSGQKSNFFGGMIPVRDMKDVMAALISAISCMYVNSYLI